MDGYFLDTNLLILLVVGSESRELIPKHRRLEHYSAEDFEILCRFLDNADRLYLTPNTLTETSNLLNQHGEPERSRFMRRLQYLIHDSNEIVVSSIDASSNPNYQRLGLTDAALLEIATVETPVLTVDFRLYWAALESGEERAVNFTPFRNL